MLDADRVLITGGAGFIGSHLAEALVARGCRVTVLDDLSTGRAENVAGLRDEPRFRLTVGSVADRGALRHAVSGAQVVFHLAAAVGVHLILEQPVRTIESNAAGTEAVLKAALDEGAKVILASTSEVYGKGGAVPFGEGDDVLLGPSTNSRWSYAVSKLLGEFLALAYHRERGLPVVVCRLFNTVGPRQLGRYGMVVPRFVRQALAGEPLTVYGDGRQSRCFLHVTDAVEALIRLAASPKAVGEVYNVGATERVTIGALAERILELAERERPGSRAGAPRVVHVPYDRAYAAGFEDMRERVPDISKIRRDVGWEPVRSLDETLRELIRGAGGGFSAARPSAPASRDER